MYKYYNYIYAISVLLPTADCRTTAIYFLIKEFRRCSLCCCVCVSVTIFYVRSEMERGQGTKSDQLNQKTKLVSVYDVGLQKNLG